MCALPRRILKLAWVLVAYLVLTPACVSTKVPPLTDDNRYGQYADEQELIAIADRESRELAAKGYVFEDPELQQYLDAVSTPLLPEPAPQGLTFRVRVLRVATINAFAMANGDIYLHTGILAALENEAQLAHVIAHEITHTLRRHQLRFSRDYHNKTVAANVASIVFAVGSAAAGSGDVYNLGSLMTNLTYAASLSGYGRDLEEQADRDGLVRMAQAGYRVEEAPRLFHRLNEVEQPDGLEAFFYSTHPANEARARYTRELIDHKIVPIDPDGRTNRAAYCAATRTAVLENLRLRIRARHYSFAQREAEEALERYGPDAWLHYYTGEAHRQAALHPKAVALEEALRKRQAEVDEGRVEELARRRPAELDLAELHYRRAIELDPSMWLAHRGLGLLDFERGEPDGARRHLESYLGSDANVPDRRYIERILQKIAATRAAEEE